MMSFFGLLRTCALPIPPAHPPPLLHHVVPLLVSGHPLSRPCHSPDPHAGRALGRPPETEAQVSAAPLLLAAAAFVLVPDWKKNCSTALIHATSITRLSPSFRLWPPLFSLRGNFEWNPLKHTGISIPLRAKLCDWAVRPVATIWQHFFN